MCICIYFNILQCNHSFLFVLFSRLKQCFVFAKYYCTHKSDVLYLHGLTVVYFFPDDRIMNSLVTLSGFGDGGRRFPVWPEY